VVWYLELYYMKLFKIKYLKYYVDSILVYKNKHNNLIFFENEYINKKYILMLC